MLNKLPRKAFYNLPEREWNGLDLIAHSIVLLPSASTRLHDNGYRFIKGVACSGDEPLYTVGICSDVFSFQQPEPIWTKQHTPTQPVRLHIDCLARSGLFRLFYPGCYMLVGVDLSSLNLHPTNQKMESLE